MRAIKPNTVVGELEETLENIEVTTGGYLTDEKVLTYQSLDKVGNSRFGEKIDFFSDGKGNILTFHYGRSLSLQKTVLAIDLFPEVGDDGITQVLDKVLQEIRKRNGNSN